MMISLMTMTAMMVMISLVTMVVMMTVMLIRCKTMPTPPRNGMVVVPQVISHHHYHDYRDLDGFIILSFQTSHGAMGLFQCKDGYTLHGTNTTKCIYGENHIFANHGHHSRHISKMTTCIYGEYHQKLIHPAGCEQ